MITDDDMAVENSTFSAGRRGVAGTLVVEKIVGAAAEGGRDLAFLKRLGDRVNARTRSMGVALTSCTVPAAGRPTFQLGEFSGDRICAFIERVERIDEEIKALNEGKKEVFAEAKGEGFDVKVLREILRLRKQDRDERDEQESLLDLYLRAMESAGSSQAKAA